MNVSRIRIVLMLLFATSCSIFSMAVKGNLTGMVVDSESHDPVPGAVVRIIETDRLFSTNESGEFLITGIENGHYTLELHHLAYQENVVKFEITDDRSGNFVFYLVPKSIEINPVTVTDYTSYSKFDDLQELSGVLKGKELQKELGLTLASTLRNETGLAIRSIPPMCLTWTRTDVSRFLI